MKVQILLSILLLLSIANSFRKLKHRTKFVKQIDETEDQSTDQNNESDFHRLKRKIIDDQRLENPNGDPFKVEYIKQQADLDAYTKQKESSPVQQNYLKNPQGNDAYSQSYIGDFYLLNPYNADPLKRVGKYSFYLNQFALYWTEPKDVNIGYRDVKGSVTLQSLEDFKDVKSQVTSKDCCACVSNIKFFQLLKGMNLNNNRQLRAEFTKIITDSKVESISKWQMAQCIELNYQYGEKNQRYIALCSFVPSSLFDLKETITVKVIKDVMIKSGKTDFTIVETSKSSYQESKEIKSYVNWSFDKPEEWPIQCKQGSSRQISSPIIIMDSIFDKLIKDTNKQINQDAFKNGKQKQINEFDAKETDDKINNLWTIKLNTDNLIVKEQMEFNKKNYGYDQHPTYTFRGFHENMILGHFGWTNLQLKNKPQDSSVNSVESFNCFAMKFKLPGEHKFNDKTYSGEIHVHCGAQSKQFNKFQLDPINPKINYAYQQYADGFTKQLAAEAEKDLQQLTDLVIIIPITQSISYDNENFFFHYLNNEDWFETAPVSDEEIDKFDGQKIKILNKDLERPQMQNTRNQVKQDPNSKAAQANKWSVNCYPGSLKCLFAQNVASKSLYYYKGTITTPPCEKSVQYVIFRNPITLNSQDYDSLKQNVFQFRSEQRQQNINVFLRNTYEKQYRNKMIKRSMDYKKVDCKKEGIDAMYKQVGDDHSSQSTYEDSQQDINNLSINQITSIIQTQTIQAEEFKKKLQENKEYKNIMQQKEWGQYFINNAERYYRRMFAHANVENRVDDIKKYINDALDAVVDFNLELAKSKDKAEKEEDNQYEQAVVMVSGEINQQQKLSAKSIRKVQQVITKSNTKKKNYTSQIDKLKKDQIVDISLTDISQSQQ